MSLFILTDSAKEQMTKLCKEHDVEAVRLEVKGGGCAGFQYKWNFANEVSTEDEIVELDQGKFVVDKMSVMFVAGTTIDYVKEVWGSSFQIRNPNATSSCGCGESFAV
jgi:iron-sulfur cluster insertion protein